MFDRDIVDNIFKKSDIDKLSLYIQNKTLNTNEIDEMGYSLLMEAIQKSSISVIQLLVDNGADVNYVANIDGEIVDCYDICIQLTKKNVNSKIAFLINNGIKLNTERLNYINSNPNIYTKLNIENIYSSYQNEINNNQFENLLPKSVKDMFVF